MRNERPNIEDVTPNAEDFITSIAEQGYRLETALADLIDNSITAGANRIEILLDARRRPFKLFLADNGSGMNEPTLRKAMQFPSSSMRDVRKGRDLGRFGLGLKTASFSQTRTFSVLSRTSDTAQYCSRTWDIELLKKQGWALKIDSEKEIQELFDEYQSASASYLSAFETDFCPRTIVVWQGLFKFEDYIEEHNCADILKSELTDKTYRHLALVFHRFMEREDRPIKIRINNSLIEPFNPFPIREEGVRRLGIKNRRLGSDGIRVEGFVLPSRSADEVSTGIGPWVPRGRSLMDLEGIYLYRADRIILYGGWLGLTPRTSKMELARMRVEIGNSADHLLQLNIAKSQVEMPHDIRDGIREYIGELRLEAEREYYNRTVRRFPSTGEAKSEPLIRTEATTRGAQMKVNYSYPLLKELSDSLNLTQQTILKTILRMVTTELNRIRRVHEDEVFTGVASSDGMSSTELAAIVRMLLDSGFDSEFIKKRCLDELGYRPDSLPCEVSQMLE